MGDIAVHPRELDTQGRPTRNRDANSQGMRLSAGPEMPRRGSGEGHSGSDTLVGGISAVPALAVPLSPDSHDDDYPFQADDEASRGRSNLILVAAVVLGLVSLAYGAGLLLDHADVPKGTTVLGVNIGGQSKDQAVRTLNDRLAERVSAPIPVKIGTATTEVAPRVAGLGIDTAQTVRQVARRDYNPVSVIGSLLGGQRTAQAEFIIDRDKLRSALKSLDDRRNGGAVKDGMVKFERGEPIAVPGKPGSGVDVDASVNLLREAYFQRAESGGNPPVELRRIRQEPKVTQEELDRAIKEFGEPAMSGLVTIKAGSATISFSPERSLPKFLSMRSTDAGRLEPYFDLPVLEELYGTVFDGLKVDHGASTGPITSRDVAVTMLPLLKETDPAKRVGEMQVVE